MNEIITTREERKKSRGVLRHALMLMPDLLRLLVRLFKDSRVPLAEKALVIGTIAYVISPLDFIPDFIPFIGQVDDLYLMSLVILRMLNRTSDDVLREHWDGAGDLAAVVDKISRAAQYVLPKKVRNVLLGRVVIAPQIKGGLASSPGIPQAVPDDIESRRKMG
ncbi:MAG: DUF1232 domain-containing protein [Acidobacteria bacterium]|nr:DUF1232 domain-containing protein [Acidobacteriota bacterium]